MIFKQSLEEELNRRHQCVIRQLTEGAGKLKEQQVFEYRALISSLAIRWQHLQRQVLVQGVTDVSVYDSSGDSMGGPDFGTRIHKLREAITSVSRQMHSPLLNFKHYEQLNGQWDSKFVSFSSYGTNSIF